MRIAFYAPMKPPDAPHPSGDRRMARLLMAALRQGGHDVSLASRLRTWTEDPARHAAIEAEAEEEAARILREGPTPELWFTYHLYYKAPDWIGPRIAAALDIPYIVAEASHAPKRAMGPWAASHAAAEAAIRKAAAICAINPADSACLLPLLDDPARLVAVKPFLDVAPSGIDRQAARAALLAETGFSGANPVALAVAMMRPGDKRESYRVLAHGLAALYEAGGRLDLAIVGDGPARPGIERAFAALPDESVRFLGSRPAEEIGKLLAGGDLYLWPAVREAYGMAVLEAQAAGLPVVAGNAGGISAIIDDGATGLLVPEGDASAFAQAVSALIADPARRRKMGENAGVKVARDHGLAAAAARLNAAIETATRRKAA